MPGINVKEIQHKVNWCFYMMASRLLGTTHRVVTCWELNQSASVINHQPIAGRFPSHIVEFHLFSCNNRVLKTVVWFQWICTPIDFRICTPIDFHEPCHQHIIIKPVNELSLNSLITNKPIITVHGPTIYRGRFSKGVVWRYLLIKCCYMTRFNTVLVSNVDTVMLC